MINSGVTQLRNTTMNKRGPKKAEAIITTELCSYGCGLVANFKNKSGKLMCGPGAASCTEIKKKNSAAGKAAYDSGQRPSAKEAYESLSDSAKNSMNWNAGKRYADFSLNGKGQHKSALIVERGYCCEGCGLSEWRGKPIVLELEHKNGDRKDNTRDNLELLCPNCHAQTPTWRKGWVKGFKTSRYTDEQLIAAIKDSENLNQVLEKLDLRYGSVKKIVNLISDHNLFFKKKDS
jgi:hypothetical protein